MEKSEIKLLMRTVMENFYQDNLPIMTREDFMRLYDKYIDDIMFIKESTDNWASWNLRKHTKEEIRYLAIYDSLHCYPDMFQVCFGDLPKEEREEWELKLNIEKRESHLCCFTYLITVNEDIFSDEEFLEEILFISSRLFSFKKYNLYNIEEATKLIANKEARTRLSFKDIDYYSKVSPEFKEKYRNLIPLSLGGESTYYY